MVPQPSGLHQCLQTIPSSHNTGWHSQRSRQWNSRGGMERHTPHASGYIPSYYVQPNITRSHLMATLAPISNHNMHTPTTPAHTTRALDGKSRSCTAPHTVGLWSTNWPTIQKGQSTKLLQMSQNSSTYLQPPPGWCPNKCGPRISHMDTGGHCRDKAHARIWSSTTGQPFSSPVIRAVYTSSWPMGTRPFRE